MSLSSLPCRAQQLEMALIVDVSVFFILPRLSYLMNSHNSLCVLHILFSSQDHLSFLLMNFSSSVCCCSKINILKCTDGVF